MRWKLRGRAQVTVLAVPIFATLDWMEKLAPVLGPEQLVTDVGSTKRVISEAAARLYNTPERAAFLPGHPMAGKERGGAQLADAESVSRRGVAVHRRSRGAAFGEISGIREELARVGHGYGREDARS